MNAFQCSDCANNCACVAAGKCLLNSFSDKGVWETTDGGAYWHNIHDDFSIDTTAYEKTTTSGQT